jgi:micrococcal nuclease
MTMTKTTKLACFFYLLVFLPITLFSGNSVLGETLTVKVDKAMDGDTLRLEDGRLVRYIGIDAPEIDHRSHSADPFGLEAYQLNASYVNAKNVVLEFDLEKKDRYGRLLAYVFSLEGVLINQALLDQGLANVLYSPPNIKYFNVLLDSQQNAIKKSVGIWSKIIKGQGTYIGNTRSKRFHVKQCRLGRSISEKNRVESINLKEAYWQGFAPCARCMPSAIRKLQQKRRRP